VAEGRTPDRFPWYDVVKGDQLQQGDILFRCPLVKPTLADLENDDPSVTREVKVEEQNAIILSQSCDLALWKGKCAIEDVILCPLYSREEMRGDKTYKNMVAWEEARKGRHPSVHILNECTIRGVEFDFMLVDLTEVFSIAVDTLREFAERQNPRVRLNPPYREHLSQAFARLFMRVGLPVDIPRFA
jgi:hypothetical protein